MKKLDMLYEGKAKKIFKTDQSDQLWVEFKNSLTAFNALKKGEFEGKGAVNLAISTLIFQQLNQKSIPSHWIKNVSDTEMLVRKVDIIPLEVVIRNVLAGSTAKKLGIEEGKVLKAPLVEFYYKNDALADPFLSDDQILMLELITPAEIVDLKKKALAVNHILQNMMNEIGVTLVDFKIEFGKTSSGEILLADEISPDCCRLWDKKTGEKLDKDRFRRDLGQIKESYYDVLSRLQGRFS